MFSTDIGVVPFALYGIGAWLVLRRWLPNRIRKEREWQNYFLKTDDGKFSAKTEMRIFWRRYASYLMPVLFETALLFAYIWFTARSMQRTGQTESPMLFFAVIIWLLANLFLIFPGFGAKMLFMKEDRTG